MPHVGGIQGAVGGVSGEAMGGLPGGPRDEDSPPLLPLTDALHNYP